MDSYVRIRIGRDEKEAWIRAAKERGETLSDMVRNAWNECYNKKETYKGVEEIPTVDVITSRGEDILERLGSKVSNFSKEEQLKWKK